MKCKGCRVKDATFVLIDYFDPGDRREVCVDCKQRAQGLAEALGVKLKVQPLAAERPS